MVVAGHGLPPNLAGYNIGLVLYCEPPPQVLLHVLYAVQSPTIQSLGGGNLYKTSAIASLQVLLQPDLISPQASLIANCDLL